VLLVNTKLVPESERPRSLLDLADTRWKGKLGIAKPTSGTTATHAACLFEVLGADKARDFFLALRANEVQIVPGNKQVAEGVSAGQFAIGITDTDDAMIEISNHKPVALIFPDREGHAEHPRLGTLFIPNTVAVIRGCPNPVGAKKLVDFLLSAEVEKRLAESQSRQIPLNPKVKADLPAPMDRPREAGGTIKSMEVDFGKAADLWTESQTFLTKEFVKP
jgi:iron(III) transport system substrate-binding protein